jgi:hypothetical protein
VPFSPGQQELNRLSQARQTPVFRIWFQIYFSGTEQNGGLCAATINMFQSIAAPLV